MNFYTISNRGGGAYIMNKNKYYSTEKGKEAVLRAVKKYNEKNKEKIRAYQNEYLKEYNKTEKAKESKRKYRNSEIGREKQREHNNKPENIEMRKLWEASEEGKAKRKLIRERYNLKMKIKNAMNKLPFEEKYILDIYLFIMYNIIFLKK